VFKLTLHITESVLNLSIISSKYYEFVNVFSKFKAEVLAPYYLYDSKINLEEDVQPLVDTIYYFFSI